MSYELNLCSDILMKHVFVLLLFCSTKQYKTSRYLSRNREDVEGHIRLSLWVRCFGRYNWYISSSNDDDDDEDDNGDDDGDDDVDGDGDGDVDGDVDSNNDDDIGVSVGGDDNGGGGGEGCSGNDDDDDDGGSGVGRVSDSIDDRDINDDASQFTTYSDFVTSSYGEFGDSSREKS